MSISRMAAVLVALVASPLWAGPLVDLVNPLQGTDSVSSLSHGNTLPLAGVPWGMTNWTVQTGGGNWFFQYGAKQVQGFRATRQPSPWMGDYGQFTLMPETGELQTNAEKRAAEYDVNASVFRPDYLKVELKRYAVTAELTATERCAAARFTFQQGDTGRLIIDPAGEGKVEVVGREIRGYSKAAHGGVPGNFAGYFVIEMDRDLTKTGTKYVEFSVAEARQVNVKIGTSYISLEQAEMNLRREVGGSFDDVRATVADVWEKHLGRIEIAGADAEQRKTFYTCMYRAILFPHRFYELDADGKAIHYSAYDGKVHDGVAYTDNGFWDTYRTVYPFYSIVYPDQLKEILEGYVAAYRESGWLPEWPSPGHLSVMIGSHIDAVFADAAAKGIAGFDLAGAYEGMRKDAFVAGPSDAIGRPGLKEYEELGYVPEGKARYSVSTTLDYAYDDWCVAQVAKKLGKDEDYQKLMARSQNYRKLWDESTGFMRPKNAQGKWAEAFDPYYWGGPYVEGGPWQCSWAVQHDLGGLRELLGGPAKMGEKLDRLLGTPPVFHVGGYGSVIHEMREMWIREFGQYAHSNQPSHHLLYLYAVAGEPWKMEYWTRRVCAELYNSGPDGFAGDEDNGEMSCWYLLSTMGVYPLCPGRPDYVLTSPAFDRATIHLRNGKDFVVAAKNNGQRNVYVQKRALDGKPYSSSYIPQAALIAGGTLDVEMGEQPNLQAGGDGELP
ncbi:MAG TPA: GH92 family glycosyl hydrolase [Tepidisphaeraceae bacterium]|jgi:predicted alpha-1,2-mannosidase|nr:GH92 family glycosyl hydrolase [Tepidisphaeraceae bacterium]